MSTAMPRVSSVLLLSITGVSAFGSVPDDVPVTTPIPVTTPVPVTCSNGAGDNPDFMDMFFLPCAEWGSDYSGDGQPDCGVANTITDSSVCVGTDGSTLMGIDGVPCEVCLAPRPRRLPITHVHVHVSEEWAVVASDVRAPCCAMQVGGFGPDSYGYYYSASHMFEVRYNCPVSCDMCPDSNPTCVDSNAFEDPRYGYTCYNWGRDFSDDNGVANCAIDDAIMDPSVCIDTTDGSTLMDSDGVPCEVCPAPHPPPPPHHACACAYVRGMGRRAPLSRLTSARHVAQCRLAATKAAATTPTTAATTTATSSTSAQATCSASASTAPSPAPRPSIASERSC